MAGQEATMLHLNATQSASSPVLELYSQHVRATSLVPPQTVKHAPAHCRHQHQSSCPELATVKSIHWVPIHVCGVQCCHPALAGQEATVVHLSCTQSTSSLVLDVYSEHVRATSRVPPRTVKHAPAHGGHRHARNIFSQPAARRALATGGGAKVMWFQDKLNPTTPPHCCEYVDIDVDVDDDDGAAEGDGDAEATPALQALV